MYKLQLIRKYLFKRRIAWVALVAVMLCTAMVLVVVSVMGGWLRAFEDSFHGMTGDVVVTGNSLSGFPAYPEMVDEIKKLSDVQGAVPVIRSGGLLNIGNTDVELVQVLGYPPDIGTVNAWPSALHLDQDKRRKELEAALGQPGLTDTAKAHLQNDLKRLPFALHPDVDYTSSIPTHGPVRLDPRDRPGIILSSSVLRFSHEKDGNDRAHNDRLRDMFYTYPVSLTLVPVKGGEQINLSSVQPVPFWIVDDAKSRVWQLDNNSVYVAFDELQKDLGMATGEDGPRCSEIEIKAKPGVDLNVLRDQVSAIAEQVRAKHQFPEFYSFDVVTWVQQQGTFIKAVQNEVVLTTVLFGIVSSVAVLLIFCIFYMIVIEKTKDIGIIKSVGATGWGILSLFLGYGLAIGTVGAGLGFLFAFFFVRYINQIHAWLGREMGIVIFSPDTYQLEKIPDRMETSTVVYALIAAVLAALLGALIPAMRAASMNPVDALRYE
jgi:lipoprotein-releasing system permease protein